MIKRLLFASSLLCLLAACGNKGPLVMPDPDAETPVVPAPTEVPPATDPEAGSGTPAARH